MTVVLDHAVRIHAQSGLPHRFLLQMREDVHPRRVEPHEERLVVSDSSVDEIETRRQKLFVDGLHALRIQRTGVLDLLRSIRVGPAVKDTARTELLLELGILGIIWILWLLF